MVSNIYSEKRMEKKAEERWQSFKRLAFMLENWKPSKLKWKRLDAQSAVRQGAFHIRGHGDFMQ